MAAGLNAEEVTQDQDQPQDQQETATEEDTQQNEQDDEQPIAIQQHSVPARNHYQYKLQKNSPVQQRQLTDAEMEAQSLAQSLLQHKQHEAELEK